MKSRKLKLISDGDPINTKLIDVESGEPIANIQSITYNIEADSWGALTITLYAKDVEVEIEGLFTPGSKNGDLSPGGVFFENLDLRDSPR